MLPCDNEDVHVPFSEGFIVVISFKSIEESFHVGAIAKYAFVYMAQTLTAVPAFCLSSHGTDNRFTSDFRKYGST